MQIKYKTNCCIKFMHTIAFLYDKHLMYAAVYNGEKYILFTPVKESFNCSVLRSIVAGYEIECALVPHNLDIERYRFIQQWNLKISFMPTSYKGTHQELPELSGKVLMGLAHHMGCILFTSQTTLGNAASQSGNPIGFIESTPVFIEDITNYMVVSAEFIACAEKISPRLLNKLNETITKVGRRRIRQQIYFPLCSRDEIYKRHAIQRAISPFVVPLRSMLRSVKCLEIRTRNDFDGLKQTLLIALEMSNLTNNLIPFRADHYSHLADLLQMVNAGHVLDGIDPELDRLRNSYNNISIRLNSVAQEIANQQECLLSVAYFPQLGFYVEGGPFQSERHFRLGNVNYYKTDEMKDLDDEIGDISQMINEKENELYNKIYKEIEQASLCFLNDYIGEVDAYCTAVEYARELSCAPPCFVSSTIKLGQGIAGFELVSDTTLENKSVFIDGEEILRKIGLTIVLAQAGLYLPFSSVELPIFDKLIYKAEQSETLAAECSTFKAEIKGIKNMLDACTNNTICLIENLGRGTSLNEGVALFLGVIEMIKPKVLMASTNLPVYDSSENGIQIAEDERRRFELRIKQIFKVYSIIREGKEIKIKEGKEVNNIEEGFEEEFRNRIRSIVRRMKGKERKENEINKKKEEEKDVEIVNKFIWNIEERR